MTKPKGIHGYLEEIEVVRLFKAYYRDSIKMTIGVVPGTIAHKLLMHIQETIIKGHPKARKLVGSAPPGQLENLLQGYLEKASSGKHEGEQG